MRALRESYCGPLRLKKLLKRSRRDRIRGGGFKQNQLSGVNLGKIQGVRNDVYLEVHE
jgi:hypothetical protein